MTTITFTKVKSESAIKLLFVITVVVLGCMAFNTSKASGPVKFYVSVNGNDLNTGTQEQPFATLEAAKIAIRNFKKRETKLTTPVEVIIGGGVYYLDETLELEPEDSGTKNATITWRAAEKERVVLSGGKAIVGIWEKVSGSKIWYRDLPETKGWTRDINKAETYQQKPDDPWHFRQLYVNGKRAIRARFPNADEQNPFLYAKDGSMEHIKLQKGEVKLDWGNETDAQINIVSNWRFFNQWNDVTSVDTKKSTIYFGPREQHGKIIEGNWFWIEGVKSELDRPGEWYLDTKKGRLYYMAEPDENPNNQKIVAPYLNRIVYLKGDVEKDTHVSYVNFKGLEFRNTTFTLGQIEARVHTDGAVLFENASDCRIEECHFENIGGYALWLHLDSKRNLFDKNTVLQSGGGGVLFTGARFSYMDDSKLFTPGEVAAGVFPILNRVTRNTVKHCGKIRYYGGGVHLDSRPASMAMAPGNYIGHNHFQDLSRNGIFAFRNQGGNIIEYNHIHDAMQTTIDGACIHIATMNHLNAPNFIMNNYLYDIWGYEQKANGKPKRHLANGIFLDWATSNTTVKNNYIYNAGGEPIKNIMGNWNLDITDNITSENCIVPPFVSELGPNGKATNGINLEKNCLTGSVIHYSDKELVTYKGNWKARTISGFWNLFSFSLLEADSSKPSEITYTLPIVEDGTYQLSLLYLPDSKNASNAKVQVHHADGLDNKLWNMKEGDKFGFAVEIGTYNFEKGKAATITISNENADGFIVADGVGFVKVEN